ncbi:MAG: hypothetical protein MUC50_24210 [Myxococcota bacterium]|jgi:hypothetical protein|nr:hypothetical protein [Myxococcota bacterium]
MFQRLTLVACFCTAFTASACDDDNEGIEQTGASCEVAEDCYPGVDTEALPSPPMCMDRVENGYCTHHCASDDDCCSVPGECEDDLPQVCAPFESTGEYYCFLSCEAVVSDQDEFCAQNAHPEFHCRSTGGGSDNRKVCVP